MSNPFIVPIDPRFTRDTKGRSIMCQGCGVRPAAHTHHIQFKKMGGRSGIAKVKSEDAANKIDLCLVCHDATHGRFSRLGGFSCAMCPRVTKCFYGARVLNRPHQHLTPPWGEVSLS